MKTDTENGRSGRKILFVVSSPSGGGKTTLCRRLLAEEPGIRLSVSHTTRPPREGEKDGREYFFTEEKDFTRLIAEGAFLEWAQVFGQHRYGTSRAEVDRIRGKGDDVLLDVDVQGAVAIKQRFPEAVLVFILPPSEEELVRRLRLRGTETAQSLAVRLETAKKELALLPRYDYALLNDDLDQAYGALRSILTAERCRVSRR